MVVGPGMYDAACERAQLDTGADAVVLIIFNGDNGSGMSMSTYEALASRQLAFQLPDVLRSVADQIEADL